MEMIFNAFKTHSHGLSRYASAKMAYNQSQLRDFQMLNLQSGTSVVVDHMISAANGVIGSRPQPNNSARPYK